LTEPLEQLLGNLDLTERQWVLLSLPDLAQADEIRRPAHLALSLRLHEHLTVGAIPGVWM
jgi:hypothetical protein